MDYTDIFGKTDPTEVYLDEVVNFAVRRFIHAEDGRIRILDLATGPNGQNPRIINRLIASGVEFEFVCSDIAPVHMVKGYRNIEHSIPSSYMCRVKFLLADANDLCGDPESVWLYDEQREVMFSEVLDDPRFSFLSKECMNGQRKEMFRDASFDLVIGVIPYGSMGVYDGAVAETARVLKIGGYHIVTEMQVEDVRSYALRARETLDEISGKPIKEKIFSVLRSASAISRAHQPHISEVRQHLGEFLDEKVALPFVRIYHTDERFPEQTVQEGDVVNSTVLVYQKTTGKGDADYGWLYGC